MEKVVGELEEVSGRPKFALKALMTGKRAQTRNRAFAGHKQGQLRETATSKTSEQSSILGST